MAEDKDFVTWDAFDRRMTELEKSELEVHGRLDKELEALKDSIDGLCALWQQGKGVLLVFKMVFFVAAPVVATIYWLRDHIKL